MYAPRRRGLAHNKPGYRVVYPQLGGEGSRPLLGVSAFWSLDHRDEGTHNERVFHYRAAAHAHRRRVGSISPSSVHRNMGRDGGLEHRRLDV